MNRMERLLSEIEEYIRRAEEILSEAKNRGNGGMPLPS